jgi:lipopolysaccharide/colanic/teichoic acid biosynthesis glycosyltransferase
VTIPGILSSKGSPTAALPGAGFYASHGKRWIDVALVVLTLPLTLLAMLVVAVAIKLHHRDNPVWFVQVRTGRDGRPFRMYKFATMVRDAEAMKAQLQHLNVLPYPDFKIPNDPRITPVGKFLRQTSLDELPQLINVLRGQMALVGPRPTSFGPSTWDPWHSERLDVRPGLTGLWQIRGRGEITFDERVRLDIAYVRGMSFALDAKILVATFTSVLSRKGL